MKKILFLIGIMAFVFTACTQNTDKTLTAYLQVKKAMVKSDVKAVTAAIKDLQIAVKTDEKYANNKKLIETINKLASEKDLEEQRSAFASVSTNMWYSVKQLQNSSKKLYYQYCPMKDAYWLSTSSKIKNPYYGSMMLECGVVKDSTK